MENDIQLSAFCNTETGQLLTKFAIKMCIEIN